MKCLKGPKVPPRWRKSVLQETATTLTGRLEELYVAPQPGLRGGHKGVRDRQATTEGN